MKNEIVIFTDGDINLEVELNPELETVWLTQKQMGELFDVKQATLSEHINNIISSGELDERVIKCFLLREMDLCSKNERGLHNERDYYQFCRNKQSCYRYSETYHIAACCSWRTRSSKSC